MKILDLRNIGVLESFYVLTVNIKVGKICRKIIKPESSGVILCRINVQLILILNARCTFGKNLFARSSTFQEIILKNWIPSTSVIIRG